MIPALIVPVLTRPELLSRLIESIDYPVGHLLIIDNGRCVNAEHVSWIRPLMVDRLDVLAMPSNLGVSGSWNLGVKSLPFAPWWLVCNFDAWFPPGALEQFAHSASRDTLLLSGGAPAWCCFALGDRVVERVGLFDEAIHPAYFEDDDYSRRCEAAGMPLVQSDIPVHHDNSSTLKAGFQGRNDFTFTQNRDYYQEKVARGDLSAGDWSLERRRVLTWD